MPTTVGEAAVPPSSEPPPPRRCGWLGWLWDWTLRLAIALLLLGSLGWCVLARLTNDENVRELVEQELQAHVRGRVAVQAAHLDLLSGVLEVRGLAIHSVEPRPDEPLPFWAEHVRIDFCPWSALRGRSPLRGMTADRPQVNWVAGTASRPDNLRETLGMEDWALDSSGARVSPAELPVLRLRSVRITRWVRLGERAVRLGELPNLDVELSPDPQHAGQLSFRAGVPSWPNNPELSGRLQLEPFVLTAELPAVRLGPELVALLPASLQSCWHQHGGGPDCDGLGLPAMALTLREAGDDARHISGPGTLEFELEAPELPGLPRVSGRFRPEPTAVELTATSLVASPESLELLPVRLRRAVQAVAPTGQIPRLTLRYDAAADEANRLSVAARFADVGGLIPLEALTGPGRAVPLSPPRDRRHLAPDWAELSELSGSVRLDSEGLTVRDLTGRLIGARFGVNLQVDPSTKRGASWHAKLAVRELDLTPTAWAYRSRSDFVDEVLKQINLTGVMDVDVELGGPLRPGDPAAAPPLARGQVRLRDGRLMCRAYRYPVDGLHGTIDFDGDRSRMLLDGHRKTGRVHVDGRLHTPGTRFIGLDLLIQTRNTPVDEELANAILPAERHHYTDWNLSGIGHSDVWIQRPANSESDALSVTVEVIADGRIHFRYKDLPVQVNNCVGVVEVVTGDREKPGGRVYKLIGTTNEGARITLEGEAGLGPSGRPRLWAHFSADKQPLTPEFVAALPEEFRRGINAVSPEGAADIQVRLLRGMGREVWSTAAARQVDYDVRIHTDSAAGVFAGFPYRLSEVATDIHLTRSELEIERLRGRHGSARVSLSGRVGRMGAAPVELTLSATEVALDADLLAALSACGHTGAWAALSPSGAVDVSARVAGPTRDPRDAAAVLTPSSELDITARGVSIHPAELPLPITDLRGTAKVRSDAVTLTGLTGRRGASTIRLDGRVGQLDGRPVELTFTADKLALDEELAAALPTKARRVWDRFTPSGVADLSGRVTGPLDRPEELMLQLDATAQGVSVKPALFPVQLTELRGPVSLGPDGVRFGPLTAKRPQGDGKPTAELRLAGSRRRGPNGQTQAELSLRAEELLFDEELRRALPARMARGVASVDPTGRVGLVLNLAATGPAEQDPVSWQFDGRMTLAEGGLDVGRRLEGVTGGLSGSGEWFADGRWWMDAKFSAEAARYRSLPLSEMAGRLTKKADSDTLIVSDLSARACGGQLSGSAQYSLGPEGRYLLRLNADRLELYDFWKGYNGKAAGVRGRVDAQVAARGSRYGDHPFEMAGEIVCRTGTVGGPLDPVDRDRPTAPTTGGDPKIGPPNPAPRPVAKLAGEPAFQFTLGSLRFRRRGDALSFQDVLIEGSGVKLAGRGTVSPRDELDLHFAVLPPPQTVRIPVLGEVIRSVANELVQIRVTGPASDPQVNRHSLDQVGGPLRELMQQEPIRRLTGAPPLEPLPPEKPAPEKPAPEKASPASPGSERPSEKPPIVTKPEERR